MSKIRINELARELEVKPNVIIDLLRDLGVPDKKTHSSSLDDDVALEVRRRVAAEGGAEGNGAGPSVAEAPHQPSPAGEHQAPAPSREAREQPAAKAGPGVAEAPRRPADQDARPEIAKEVSDESAAPAVKPHPLRPPLSATSPSLPLMPPVARGSAIPARPVPSPKPGQIISGPRQPMPSGVGDLPGVPPQLPIPGSVQASTPGSVPAPGPSASGITQPGVPRHTTPAHPVPSIPTPRSYPRPAAPGAPAPQHLG